SRVRPYSDVIAPQALNDLGNLLLTLVIVFAYMEFAQYLINWSGNEQNEITWYAARTERAWWWLAAVLVVFHFFVPFFLLLWRRNKRNISGIVLVACIVLAMRMLYSFWMIAPSGTSLQPHTVSWVAVVFSFVTPLGIGGVWFSVFLWLLSRRSAVPLE